MNDVVAVSSLDLGRYVGRWYEICRLPLKWEDEAATDITANYSFNNAGNIEVDNRCFDAKGKPTQAKGEAVPVDAANSRLKVTFLPEFIRWIPFTHGNYWVLKIDPEYRTALVGTPDRNNLWLLSREPNLLGTTLDNYLAAAKSQGFELSKLITPKHTGRVVTDSMVERAN